MHQIAKIPNSFHPNFEKSATSSKSNAELDYAGVDGPAHADDFHLEDSSCIVSTSSQIQDMLP